MAPFSKADGKPEGWRPAANILMTCAHDFGVGGMQTVFRNLVRFLERSGRNVHLLYQARLPGVRLFSAVNAWGRPALYCPLPVIVRDSVLLSVPIVAVYLPIALFHLTRLIRRHKIHVVNCHGLSPYFLHLVIAARLSRRPLVLSLHGADIDRFCGAGRARQLVLRLVVRGANTVVACSRALARHTVEVFPEARDKTTYVHNGLELSQFEAIRPARPGGRFVLTVCRQVEKKGVDTLLRSFALARPRLPGVSLVIVGDGPLLAQNKALAYTLGIAEQVRFVGSVPRAEVLALFAACDLFVLASRREPFGLVLLEAAYYRKAILATRVGGIPEVLTHDVSAILVDPDDAVEMARHMSGLLGDTDRAQRLGAQAHRTLMDRFLWADRVRDYIAVYEGVWAQSPVVREVGAPI